MSYDLLALGETMIALAPPPGEALRDAACWRADHAGAESNTCVGLARLGFRTAWVSRLGADAAGDRILHMLSAEGVDTQWVRRDPHRPTGLMIKDPDAGVRYYRTGSAASALEPSDLDRVPVADARAVLVSGVTALIGPEPQATALAFLDRARGLRIVDPNLRRGLWGSERRRELVLPLIERCDLLFAGSQELVELVLPSPDASFHTRTNVTGDRPLAEGPAGAEGAELEALARRAAARGPREVVVRGARVVGALDRDGAWHMLDISRDAAVDPIGAGDAFNAGYMAIRLKDGSIDEALAAGARCGKAVTQAMSDTAGFPRSL